MSIRAKACAVTALLSLPAGLSASAAVFGVGLERGAGPVAAACASLTGLSASAAVLGAGAGVDAGGSTDLLSGRTFLWDTLFIVADFVVLTGLHTATTKQLVRFEIDAFPKAPDLVFLAGLYNGPVAKVAGCSYQSAGAA